MGEVQIPQSIIDLATYIGENYGASRILLFGSQAQGSAGPDSDIDLLIIKETSARFLDRVYEVLKLTNGRPNGMPIEVLVLTPAEIQKSLDAGDVFIDDILKDGVELYAA